MIVLYLFCYFIGYSGLATAEYWVAEEYAESGLLQFQWARNFSLIVMHSPVVNKCWRLDAEMAGFHN